MERITTIVKLMLKSSLCDYSEVYILVSGTVTIDWAGADDNAKRADERDKGVIFKNCAPFTNCIREINILKQIMQKIWML